LTVVNLTGEIRSTLRAAGGGGPRSIRNVHGHAGAITSYGVDRNRFKEIRAGWSKQIRDLGLDDKLAIAAELLRTHIEEEGHLAVGAIRSAMDQLAPRHFRTLDSLVDELSSWSMVDDFATGKAGVTPLLLDKFEKETLAMHRRWRKSSRPMKRRAGIVTFTRAVAAGGRYVDEILSFCEELQFDPQDLVQKAVGWSLKDVMRAGAGPKRRAIALVKRMRRSGVPSTISLYALRDLPADERARLLAL